MGIELQWAFTEKDMREGPCAICEVEFKPHAVIIRCDPYGDEVCEVCLRMFSGRKEQEPRAKLPWPTWEDYQEALREHPEPMFPDGVPSGDDNSSDYERSLLWVAD